MSLSILHRIAGMALSAGLPLLVLWLVAVAAGEGAYRRLFEAGGVLLQLALALWVVAFVYHLANGIRHLFWDAGIGLERVQARRSGRIVVVLVALVSALLLAGLFFRNAP